MSSCHARERECRSTFSLSDVHKRNDFLRPRALGFSTRRFATCSSNVLYVGSCYVALCFFYALFSPPLTGLDSYQFLPPLRVASEAKQQENINLYPNDLRSWGRFGIRSKDACRVETCEAWNQMDKRKKNENTNTAVSDFRVKRRFNKKAKRAFLKKQHERRYQVTWNSQWKKNTMDRFT